MDNGAFALMVSAISIACDKASPSSTMCPIRPNLNASSADIRRPVSKASAAKVYGICLLNRTVEPPSGNNPRRGSDRPKTADFPATLTSVL